MGDKPKFNGGFGLPAKEGTEFLSIENWNIISSFIREGKWYFDEPCLEEDRNDPLLKRKLPYGALALGFDFHITDRGPKLIEINTNAGGLATVFALSSCEFEREWAVHAFVTAIKAEYAAARKQTPNTTDLIPKYAVIIDDDVTKQKMYPEMLHLAGILAEAEIKTMVVSPEDLEECELEDGIVGLRHKESGTMIQFAYNRLTDFRLTEPAHQHLRRAAIPRDDGREVIFSPHPSAYVRIADKRNMTKLHTKTGNSEIDKIHEAVIPITMQLKDKPLEEWIKLRKNFVFKPPDGRGSSGVYRGDGISLKKLQTLSPDTIVQEYCPPSISGDGSKYDLRVYTRDKDFLGIATRHFTGQVMEMKSAKAGFRHAIPEGVCCFPILKEAKLADNWKSNSCNC